MVESDAIDAAAAARAFAVQPRWSGSVRMADALGITGRVLLHAGPPFEGAPCTPILNSACVAAVLEGWARSVEEAGDLVRGGEIRLEPAQDHGVVVPLAGIASPSTQLVVVDDLCDPTRRLYSPLNEGTTHGLRLGRCDATIIDHLRWLNNEAGEAFARALDEPIPLLPVADLSLQRGDDCHGRTVAATARIAELMAPRLRTDRNSASALAFLKTSHGFFLNLWMAASALMMRSADGTPHASLVRAAAGNGVQFGIQVAGMPGRWFTSPAQPPQGPVDDPRLAVVGVGAIGDSAVVDCFGLGGMVLSFAKEVAMRLKDYLPADFADWPQLCLAGVHPGLPRSRARAALTARRVVASQRTPLVTLGIVDRSGIRGRIGGGIYEVPLQPFTAAVEALEAGRATHSPGQPRA